MVTSFIVSVTVSFSVIQCAQPFIPTVSDFDMKLVGARDGPFDLVVS